MAVKKKVVTKKAPVRQEEDNEQTENLVELKKLKDTEVNALKGKLLEVRRIGAHPIFVEITRSDSVSKALEKADVPTSDSQIKVEGVKANSTKWEALKLSSIVFPFAKIAVTTKVKGSF
jgi:hypothetical protein